MEEQPSSSPPRCLISPWLAAHQATSSAGRWRPFYAYPDGQVALVGVTMHVDRGEKIALVGLNGAGKSTFLVLDEPTDGLDPRVRRELIGLLPELEVTMLAASHDMHLVAELFPRMIILDGGRVVADGPTDELLRDETLLQQHGLEAP